MRTTCLLLTFCVISLTGCNKKIPASNADIQAFQKHYSETVWFLTQRQWNLEKIENVTVKHNNSLQISVEFPSGTYIDYSEYAPLELFEIASSSRGHGTLNTIPNINKPIFQVTSNDSGVNNSIIIIGFVGAKRFEINIRPDKNISREQMLSDALTVANSAYQYLLKVNDKIDQ